jgi:hypothetical protein
MDCPHCGRAFHANREVKHLGGDTDGQWNIEKNTCPACQRLVLHLVVQRNQPDGIPTRTTRLVWPKATGRRPTPPEVPEDLRTDYEEAAAVLADSAKASAALTRRALQHLLREYAGVKPANLQAEIQEAIDSGKVPHYIAEQLDAVRNIGNFAAHPIKSKQSGEVVPVEDGEAEWNLDVLESLFQFFFVAPAAAAAKKDALNAKLREAGKPEMP